MHYFLYCISCFFTTGTSVADPYHFDTDPDPGYEKICYGSGSGVNFDTDRDPGKNDTDPAKKDEVPGKSSKSV